MEEVAEKDAHLSSCCTHFFLSTLGCQKAEEIDAQIIKAIDYCCSNKDTLILTGCSLVESIHDAEQKKTMLTKLIKA